MNEKELIVSGFLFNNKKEYDLAMDESQTIEYIKNKTDLTSTKTVLKLYSKLIENETFKTPVGYGFLKELQEQLLESNLVSKDNILPIPMITHIFYEDGEHLSINQYKQRINKLRVTLRNVRIINFFMIVTIIIMFFIAMFADKSKYAEFETQIIDKYASWEEELLIREKAIEEKENLLEDK